MKTTKIKEWLKEFFRPTKRSLLVFIALVIIFVLSLTAVPFFSEATLAGDVVLIRPAKWVLATLLPLYPLIKLGKFRGYPGLWKFLLLVPIYYYILSKAIDLFIDKIRCPKGGRK